MIVKIWIFRDVRVRNHTNPKEKKNHKFFPIIKSPCSCNFWTLALTKTSPASNRTMKFSTKSVCTHWFYLDSFHFFSNKQTKNKQQNRRWLGIKPPPVNFNKPIKLDKNQKQKPHTLKHKQMTIYSMYEHYL